MMKSILAAIAVTAGAMTGAFPACVVEIVTNPPAEGPADGVLGSALAKPSPGDGVALRAGEYLFFGNTVDWQSPLTWGRNLDLSLPQVQAFKDLKLEQGSLTAEANLDKAGRSKAGCPALHAGAELALPDYIEKPTAGHISPFTSATGPAIGTGRSCTVAASSCLDGSWPLARRWTCPDCPAGGLQSTEISAMNSI